MSYLLIVLAVWATIHWVYEGIVAPTLRTRARFRLFALRDRLRQERSGKSTALTEHAYREMQESLNAQIRFADRFDFAMFLRANRAFKEDPELRRRAEARAKTVEECKDPQLKSIRSESVALAVRLFAIGSGALLAYAAPIVLVGKCVHYWGVWKEKARANLRKLLMIEEPEWQRITPKLGAASGSKH